jgi:hypothetical protein
LPNTFADFAALRSLRLKKKASRKKRKVLNHKEYKKEKLWKKVYSLKN